MADSVGVVKEWCGEGVRGGGKEGWTQVGLRAVTATDEATDRREHIKRGIRCFNQPFDTFVDVGDQAAAAATL